MAWFCMKHWDSRIQLYMTAKGDCDKCCVTCTVSFLGWLSSEHRAKEIANHAVLDGGVQYFGVRVG